MRDIDKIINAAKEGNGGSISNIINQAQTSTTSDSTDRFLCHSANGNQNSNLTKRTIIESLENGNKNE